MNGNLLNKQIPVEYHKGYFKLLTNLPLDEGEKLKVEIVRPVRKRNIKSSTIDSVIFKKTMEAAFGAVPDLPDGVKYTADLRKKWDDELKTKWHEK